MFGRAEGDADDGSCAITGSTILLFESSVDFLRLAVLLICFVAERLVFA